MLAGIEPNVDVRGDPAERSAEGQVGFGLPNAAGFEPISEEVERRSNANRLTWKSRASGRAEGQSRLRPGEVTGDENVPLLAVVAQSKLVLRVSATLLLHDVESGEVDETAL